jgi:TusA-related sulfurtransferase
MPIAKTKLPVLNEFARELKKLGKGDLLEILISSPNAMDNLRRIADRVGFDEYPVEGEPKDVYLNKIWPYILEYDSETATNS